MQVNERIRARQIRVIDPDGQQIGIIEKSKALELAQSYNLDLVEI